MLASVFDFRADLFHTVFNRTVENFYRIFTIRRPGRWKKNCCGVRAARVGLALQRCGALSQQRSVSTLKAQPKTFNLATAWYHPCLPRDVRKPR